MEPADMGDLPAWRDELKALLGNEARYYPSRLEASFPRILGKIVSLWGKPELDAYFNELMLTDRFDRQGFPDSVAMELFYLSSIPLQHPFQPASL